MTSPWQHDPPDDETSAARTACGPEIPVAATVRLPGVALHSGALVCATLERRPGRVTLRQGGVEVRASELAVASTERATTVTAGAGRLRVGTVEHLMAALAGLGIEEGVGVVVAGPEMPLLDGGAAAWCAALRSLDVPRGAPRLRITRRAEFDIGVSRYVFSPGEAVDIGVRVVFDDIAFCIGRAGAVVFDEEARWHGDGDDFCHRIAPARTFALASEVQDLAARGLAQHVAPESVLVLQPEGILCAGAPATRDEPARHKLLDLLGDLYLYGGVTLGRIDALRPGHKANHEAFARARSQGIFAVTG